MKKWIIDPDHSVAAFAVKHLMITYVRGLFNKISGAIYFEPDKIIDSSVEAEIDISGLTTGVKKRDEHLLSPDFFDAAKYPKMTYKSTRVEQTGGNRGRITGDLTIHGITKSVTLEAEFSGPVKSPFGGEITMGFSAKTSINQEDFGILWNVPVESGGFMVNKSVDITLDIEADLTVD